MTYSDRFYEDDLATLAAHPAGDLILGRLFGTGPAEPDPNPDEPVKQPKPRLRMAAPYDDPWSVWRRTGEAPAGWRVIACDCCDGETLLCLRCGGYGELLVEDRRSS